MKKNIAIGILAVLAIVFLYRWQSAEMSSVSHKKKVAQLSEIIVGQMKTGQENFEWQEDVRKMGTEKLLKKSLKEVSGQKEEDIKIEIQKRLLGYPREINVAESRRDLIRILLQSPTGQIYLASFMAEAKETIRIYEEESKR